MGWELNTRSVLFPSLRILSTPQRTSLWCLHSKDRGEEEVWENGICVCGGVCVRAKNSLVFNELVNGKEEITAACKSLSICWFPFVLEIKLFSTWGGGGQQRWIFTSPPIHKYMIIHPTQTQLRLLLNIVFLLKHFNEFCPLHAFCFSIWLT